MEIEIGTYLRKLRGNKSLREIERISGVSHTYISSIEKGIDPRSKNKITPTPETLKKLSKAYNTSYAELMVIAGYWGEEDLLEPLEEVIHNLEQEKRNLNITDVKEILKLPNIVYDGKNITKQDKILIETYLDTLFSNR